jgi:hypothetical protein
MLSIRVQGRCAYLTGTLRLVGSRQARRFQDGPQGHDENRAMRPRFAKRHVWRLVFRLFEESLEPLRRLSLWLLCNEFALHLPTFLRRALKHKDRFIWVGLYEPDEKRDSGRIWLGCQELCISTSHALLGHRCTRLFARGGSGHVFIRVTQALHLGAHTSVGHAQSQDSKFAVGCLTCRIQSRTEQILRQYIWRKAGSNRGGLAT